MSPDPAENAAEPLLDFPTAWRAARATKVEQHHEACSYRQSDGAILCDCAAMDAAREARREIEALRAERDARKTEATEALAAGLKARALLVEAREALDAARKTVNYSMRSTTWGQDADEWLAHLRPGRDAARAALARIDAFLEGKCNE